jgi:hypothetical protein
MSDDVTVKKVFLGEPDRRRKAGRSKIRWLECIENDRKSMDVKSCRKKAEESIWATILMETLVEDCMPVKKNIVRYLKKGSV